MGGVVQECFEKGGSVAPSAPPLNPPMYLRNCWNIVFSVLKMGLEVNAF